MLLVHSLDDHQAQGPNRTGGPKVIWVKAQNLSHHALLPVYLWTSVSTVDMAESGVE